MQWQAWAGLALDFVAQLLLLAFFLGKITESIKAMDRLTSEKFGFIDGRVQRIETFIDNFLKGLVKAEFDPSRTRADGKG